MKTLILSGLLLSFTLIACDKDKKVKDVNQTTMNTDSLEVREILKKYTESINNADSVLGSQIFSQSTKVSFIHPRGHEKGWKEINNSIYNFFGDTFSTRDLKAFDENVTIYNNTAWVEFYWIFNATFKSDNAPLQTKGRETQILKKSNGQWRIVHVHYSNMPVTGDREGF